MTKAVLMDRLERAFGGALDNELGDGYDSGEARARVLRFAKAYADNYGLNAVIFLEYVKTQVRETSHD